jgi:Rrf2 family protein
MKLPTKIRYAVRAVVELADKQRDTPVSVKEISEVQGMSAKYVKQLMNRLQKAGLVRGHPGIHGGYTLAKEPGSISLYDIYQALDVSLVLVPCVGAHPDCERQDLCSARLVWKRLHDSLEETLKDTSVKELAKCERDLREGGVGL